MKRLFVIVVMGMVLSGCAMTDVEWNDLWSHSNTYRNWDHMKFSWSGYNHPTVETGRMSREQGWWGKPIPGPGG